MIATNYTKLFSIEFLHDAYSDREEILRDVSIEPDEATQQIMNGYRLYSRIEHNRFLCFVQTIATIDISSGSAKVNVVNKPLVSFNENVVLNFRIVINSSRFFNNSNLRRYYSTNKILRFGNDSGNKRDALLSLSNKIPAYKSSEVYKPGMLTTNTSNLSFEAIKESDPAHPQNTTKTQFWIHISDNIQFVNQADLVNNSADEKCFALISVSFKKNLANQFSLLRKSNVVAEDNTILGKEYLIHFKNNEAN
jgi:hypothetical protein